MQVLSLFDLTEHVRRVLALNFPDLLWVQAEIGQAGSSKGHLFMELVEKDPHHPQNLLAQAPAVVWARDLRRLQTSLGPALGAILSEGMPVRLRVRVLFHERYGLKLQVEDVDPAHTYGQLELQRRQTLETLRVEGLLDRNRALSLPAVLQRVAVISSEGAAGYQDFRVHLAENAFGYQFHCVFFQSGVQGLNAAEELSGALREVAHLAGSFDCAVVLRGGGARLDLQAFDQLDLCRTLAAMPLPVFTGIGHEIDLTVADRVAHTNLKTPTAVADFLLQHNLFFENTVLQTGRQLQQTADYRIQVAVLELQQADQSLRFSVARHLDGRRYLLDLAATSLDRNLQQALDVQARFLNQAEQLVGSLDPQKVLARGYSLTTHNGETVAAAAAVKSGDEVETRTAKGSFLSVVK